MLAQALAYATQPSGFKRRSEVDRRLDSLLNQRRVLRDPNPQNITALLRLFNLCDVGTAAPNEHSPNPLQPLKPASFGKARDSSVQQVSWLLDVKSLLCT